MIGAPAGDATSPDAPGDPVRSVEDILERQAADAMALAGAGGSAWNGRVAWLPRPGGRDPVGVVGVAEWDGTVFLNREYVERPLQALFGRTAALGSSECLRARGALSVVLHENLHLLESCPGDHAATRACWSWPLVVLEEGVTEAFTQARLDAYIVRLGLDRGMPELLGAASVAAYPLFVPAAETITRGVGRLTGEPGLEVQRRLVCEAGVRKFGLLGNLVLEGSGVGARVPPSDREAAAQTIAQAAADILGLVGRLGSLLSREASMKVSRQVGREALARMLRELERLDAASPVAVEAPGPGIAAPRRVRSPVQRSQRRWASLDPDLTRRAAALDR